MPRAKPFPQAGRKRAMTLKFVNKSYLIAGLAVVIIALWFIVNAVSDGAKPAPAPLGHKEAPLPTVVTRTITAELHPNVYRLFGRTEANREVQLKAETAGLVIATPITEGTRVARGATLCRQDIDARQASLDQANAQLRSAEFDLRSTQTLVDKGFRSATQLANLQAQVDGAKAGVKQAEIELDNVNIRAPFNGIFDMRMAETGDYLAPGQPCGLLIDMDPLVIVADLSETQVGNITVGQTSELSLATGESLTGTVRFIEARANPATRTFRTEIVVPNPDYALRAGVTASVRVKAGETRAHLVPGAVLTLTDGGDVGVRYVDSNNIVRFAETQTIDEQDNGLWVTGLPDTANVIIQGQDFVSIGTEVKPVSGGSTSTQASVQ